MESVVPLYPGVPAFSMELVTMTAVAMAAV